MLVGANRATGVDAEKAGAAVPSTSKTTIAIAATAIPAESIRFVVFMSLGSIFIFRSSFCLGHFSNLDLDTWHTLGSDICPA